VSIVTSYGQNNSWGNFVYRLLYYQKEKQEHVSNHVSYRGALSHLAARLRRRNLVCSTSKSDLCILYSCVHRLYVTSTYLASVGFLHYFDMLFVIWTALVDISAGVFWDALAHGTSALPTTTVPWASGRGIPNPSSPERGPTSSESSLHTPEMYAPGLVWRCSPVSVGGRQRENP